MIWVKLHEHPHGNEIYVNLEKVSSFQRIRNDRFTYIWFAAGHEDGRAKVVETPEEIIELTDLPILERPE